MTTLALPQFVHGAAYLDVNFDSSLPVVVVASGMMPDTVEVAVDGAAATMATNGATGWVADIPMVPSPGKHTVLATAKIGGVTTGTLSGSLVAATGSLEFTKIATDGLAYSGNMMHDVAGDALLYTWISIPTKHRLNMNRLDGAFARLLPSDVAINDPGDEPLNGYTALGPMGLGVVYRTANPNSQQWLVKMRVVDPKTGAEVVPVMDLTQGQAAFEFQAAGADPTGFSAAWLHVPPPKDGGAAPLEVRFARYDMTAKQLVGPITIDMDQPANPSDPTMSPQSLEPTTEMSIACNASVCLVSYVRDIYNSVLQMTEQKVLVATVDIMTGTLVGAPLVVSGAASFDIEMWGNQIITLADGTFLAVWQETLIPAPACKTPMYPNDNCCIPGSEESDAFYTVRFDAMGKRSSNPTTLFAAEGTREYPRIAEHPEGFGLFWEDQRTECNPNGGFIHMSANLAAPVLTSLLDTYTVMPGSIVLPPEDPSLAIAGTNLVVSWSDNRRGNGLTDIQTEQFLDTYWRK